jgi:hypothetical protein
VSTSAGVSLEHFYNDEETKMESLHEKIEAYGIREGFTNDEIDVMLNEFWKAVEDTDGEINEVLDYFGIEID